MKFKQILGISLIPLNSLLLFFLLFESSLVVPSWLQVFGRMHPLLLHFPIVLSLVFVALLFIAPRKLSGNDTPAQFAEWFLLLSALTCTLTALMGFFLSQDGYEQDAITWHKWSGVALPFLLFLVYSFRQHIYDSLPLSRSIAVGIALFITATAHYGGVITHGENFVLQPLTPEKTRIVPSLEEAIVFADLVQPIIDDKCLSCHNNKKAKGELIMETRDLLLKGGENGPLWDTAAADLGLMMKRIHLPEDDKKHMPPAGKPQLTDEEIAILGAWIKSGAEFDKRVIELAPTDTLFLLAKRRLKPSSEIQYDFPAADDKLVVKLSNNNRVIAPVAAGSPALRVNFFNRTFYTQAALRELEPLAQQVVEINLINMPVKDDDLAALSSFANLRKLYLNFSGISGKTLNELKALPNLQVLSLTGTPVESNYLRVLPEFPKLHTVYLWNTAVTPEQISDLRKADKRIAYQGGFTGDTLIMQLTPPMVENENQVIRGSADLVLKHNINGTEIRYTLDGKEPDSTTSEVYNEPFKLEGSVTVKARAFKKGWISSDAVERYFFKSTHVPDTAILNSKPTDRFRAAGAKTLIDNEKSDMNSGSGKWLGFRDEKLSVLLVLDTAKTIRNITLSTMRDLGAHIFPPRKVEVWAGVDENNLKLVSTVQPEVPTGPVKNINMPVECNFEPVNAKYVRVVAEPLQKIPAWHDGKGNKAHLFLDEIFVN